MIDSLWADVRQAARRLCRTPRFTIAVVATLGLAIGGNSAIFACVDGFILHPFGYPQPDRVVAVGSAFPSIAGLGQADYVEVLSPAEFLDLRQVRSIETMLAFDFGNRNLVGSGAAERVATGLALTDPFGPFRTSPFLGRGFTAGELAPGGARVAILSHRLWEAQLGADPRIIGRSIRVNGVATQVVGVMPPELLVLGIDLWLPWGADPLKEARNARQYTVVGRLAAGRTLDDANADLRALAQRVGAAHAAQFPEYRDWQLSARPWDQVTTNDVQASAVLLLASGTVLLLLACANVASVVLARNVGRRREIALRMAMGASRMIIARQVLAEAFLLGAGGGMLGLLLADGLVDVVTRLQPQLSPELTALGLHADLSPRVLAWTAVTAMVAATLVALFPAWQTTSAVPQQALHDGGPAATAGRHAVRVRHGLLAAEVALCVALLATAGLLVRTVANLSRVAVGFDTHRILTMRMTLPTERYRGAAQNAFFDRVIERLSAVPGVTSVSAATQIPLASQIGRTFQVVGRPETSRTQLTTMFTVTSDRHFATLGMPLLEGRGFSTADQIDAPRVAVVNRMFATRFLGGRALGQRLQVGQDQISIVGVVADVRNQGILRPAAPEVFIPLHQQQGWNQVFLHVRTVGTPSVVLPAVRAAIAELDRDQPVYFVRTLDEVRDDAALEQRGAMSIVTLVAIVGLALVAVGIHGVVAYTVTSRTRDIAIRIAVGANRERVLWLVMRDVLRLVGVGAAIGFALVVMAGSTLRAVVVDVAPTDPAILLGAIAVLTVAAVLCASPPAWRACTLDPARALKCE